MTTFHIGAILSVLTGRVFARPGDIQHLLEHMAGEPVWTHQMPRVCDECVPALRAQFPQLAAVTMPEFIDDADVFRWVAAQADQHGAMHTVVPLDPAAHTSINPVAELQMCGVEVLAVVVPERES